MPEEEKKEEDIIRKLEELRKRPKVEAAAKPTAAIIDEESKKKRKARVIGSIVVLIIVAGVFFFGYQRVISPLRKEEAPPQVAPGTTAQPTQAPAATKAPAEEAVLTEAEYKKELEKVKAAKIEEANSQLAGLPVEFNSLKNDLISTITAKSKIEDAKAIDIASISTEIWRESKKRDVDKNALIGTVVIAYLYPAVDNATATPSYYEIVKGAENIKKVIGLLNLAELKSLVIKATKAEYIPIRLPRERAGGFAEKGDKISIYYRETLLSGGIMVGVAPLLVGAGGENLTIRQLVKDGVIIEVMRAQSAGSITLSEAEAKSDTGGGAEGKGTIPTLSIGSLGTITSDSGFGASIGYKTRTTSSAYSVNLAEIQKAAAAGKISEKELMESLEKYGVKLSELERETNLGNLDEEFFMLVEVTEEEAKLLILRLLNSDEKANLFITISATPQWAK